MHLCQQGVIGFAGTAGFFFGTHGLGTAHILRVLAAEGELGQTQGVGAVGGSLTGGDQLVGGRNRVGDVGRHLQQQVVAQRCDLRPVLDVGAQLEQGVVVALAKALIHAGVVAGRIVLVLRHGGIVVDVGGRGQDAAVGRGGCDAPGIHQGHTRQLAIAGLGAFAAGEVAGGVADGQCPVGGHIACAEAGAAESRAHGGTAGHQFADHAGAHQFHHDGLTAGVHTEGIVAAAAGAALEDGSRLIDAVVQTACTTGDHALVHPQLAVLDLAAQVQVHILAADELLHILFAGVQDVLQIGVQLFDGKGIGGVHGQSDHRTDGRQIHFHNTVIVGKVRRSQLFVIRSTAVHGKELLRGLVGLPDGGQAGGLGGHGVDGVAGVLPQGGNAGADELHDLVLDIAALEQLAHQRNGHIVGAAAGRQAAGEVNGHHTRTGHIVGAAQQLLCQLAAALADGHGAQCTVAGVGVRAKDHFAAAGKLFTHVLVDDSQMRGHKDAAVLFGSRQAEAVVILVDGAAHGAQAVVAVGEHIRDGELFQAGRAGRLDDAHKGDVMAGHGVKLDLQVFGIAAGVVSLQNAVGHGTGLGVFHRSGIKALGGQCCRCVAVCRHPLAAGIVCAAGAAFDHIQHLDSPLFFCFPPAAVCGHCPGRTASGPLPRYDHGSYRFFIIA